MKIRGYNENIRANNKTKGLLKMEVKYEAKQM